MRRLVDKTWVIAQKDHNFWFDRLIAFKFLHGFLEAIFLQVAMESLFDVEEVLSARLE